MSKLSPVVEAEAKVVRAALESYRNSVHEVLQGVYSLFNEKAIAATYFGDIERALNQFLNPVPLDLRRNDKTYSNRRGRARAVRSKDIDVRKLYRYTRDAVIKNTKGSRRQEILEDFVDLIHSFAHRQPKPIVKIPFDVKADFFRVSSMSYRDSGVSKVGMGSSDYELTRSRKETSYPFIEEEFVDTITQVDLAFAPYFDLKKDPYSSVGAIEIHSIPDRIAEMRVSIGILFRNKHVALCSHVITGRDEKKLNTDVESEAEKNVNYSLYTPSTAHSFWNKFYNTDYQTKAEVNHYAAPCYCRDVGFLMKNPEFVKALNERTAFLVTATKAMRHIVEKHAGNVFLSKDW